MTAERLRDARLLLLFTPDLVPAGRDPLEVLAAALPWVDGVQVRAKPRSSVPSPEPAPARAAYDWTRAVLALAAERGSDVVVMVDDRVDVASALAGAGCAGVHLGQDDCPADVARAELGAEALIGLSTHDGEQLAAAARAPVDYLGFGPVFPTATKGYGRGLGAEAAWVASSAASVPVFAIGGVALENAGELAPVGRAAVGSAVLAAPDPAAAARALRALLAGDGDALR